ncbi:unnamed protein product [Enterobius vermicularis]|uniref:DRIM domain-containing protein n=1 Tax=Enterobius vermicularis TaxID=51028 RepID=A0A0N4UV95_ENTVE|nr:unnamed protein product [Enterobius vermicularis]
MVKRKSTAQHPFKFISFAEQLSKINIDITRWKTALPTTTEDKETFFHDALARGAESDFGSYFKAFLDDLPLMEGELRTYAQLLFHQKLVFNTLLKHLLIKGNTSLPTLLEITLAFVRDLREDMGPYLWDLFRTVIDVVENCEENVEVLESAFRALAIIFKLHWRIIVKKLRRTFIRFQSLFSSSRSYIRRFAAEAFAFLLRKSSVIGKVVTFLTETVQKVFTEIIDASLEFSDQPTLETATVILEGTVALCIAFTKKDYILPLTDIILVGQKNVIFVPHNFLRLLSGDIVTGEWKPHPLTLKLISESIKRSCGAAEDRSQAVSLMESVVKQAEATDVAVMCQFFSDLVDLSIFDIFLMPSIGKFYSKVLSNSSHCGVLEILKFYALLCAERRRINVDEGERVLFFDVSDHLAVRECVLDIIRNKNSENREQDVLLLYGCSVYPWLWRGVETVEALDDVMVIFNDAISGKYGILSSYLSVLSANAVFLTGKDYFANVNVDDLLNFLKYANCKEAALKVLNMILPYTHTFLYKDHMALSLKVARELLPFFSNHKSSIRQLALRCLNHFDFPLPLAENEDKGKADCFLKILLEVERTELTIESYRNRLMLLRKLSYGAHKKYIPENFDSALETILLRVVIAQLYERFTIYWDQLFEIIESYARGFSTEVFWPVFYEFITNASSHINAVSKENAEFDEDLDILCGISGHHTPDYVTFRLQLFRMLDRIPDVAEQKSCDLSPLLLNLFRNEYENPSRQNIQQQNILFTDEVLLENCEDSSASDEEEKKSELTSGKDEVGEQLVKRRKLMQNSEIRLGFEAASALTLSKKEIKKTIITLLEVFSKFKSPRKIYMAKEIRSLYDELLLIGDPEAQKAVLTCLFGYHYNYLNPYRTNFEKLIDERTFLNELVLFGVDPQCTTVAAEHRDQTIAILMRVLYGKLNTHVPKGEVARKAAVYRFLAGCSSNELGVFLSILFLPLIEYTNGKFEIDLIRREDLLFPFLFCNFILIQNIVGQAEFIRLHAS